MVFVANQSIDGWLSAPYWSKCLFHVLVLQRGLRFIKGEWASMLFTMISYYFSSITRHRFPRIYEVLVRKDFSRFFDVLWKFYSEKTITESKCLFGCHDDRMTCAVQRRQWRYVNRLALHLEVPKSSFGERWISFGKRNMSFETRLISFGKHEMSFETQLISFGKHEMSFETRKLLLTVWNASMHI